ncbi:hypothetical protein ACFLZP_02560 [Patescibacteria group bacterium]
MFTTRRGTIVSLSGIRGIWGQDLNKKEIIKFCLAGAKIFTHTPQKKIFIGRDTRKSGEIISSLASQVFVSLGFKMVDLGIIPTPILQSYTQKRLPTGALMITASHNPSEYNGLKFLQSSGIIFSEEQVKKLFHIYQGLKNIPSLKLSFKTTPVFSLEKPIQMHFDKILSKINIQAIKQRKFKVVVDAGNGVGSFLNKFFLESLGCQVKELYSQKDGIFRRGIEPKEENLAVLKRAVLENKADLGFAQDGDGDRLAVIDSDGKFISGDDSFAILAKHFLKIRQIKTKRIVVNTATSRKIDEVVKKYQGIVYKTPVGEVNVVNKALAVGAEIAGETSCSGTIWLDVCPGRDSFSAMALILESLALEKEQLTDRIKKLPFYVRLEAKIKKKPKKMQTLFKKLASLDWPEKKISQSKLDGLRVDFKNSWFLIRVSNTEPVLRLIVESRSRKEAEKLVAVVKKVASGGV